MDSLGTLAGGMAHDLNNILAPVLCSLYLLREKVVDSEGRQLLETMEASVQRGAGLIKQVLAFGRGIRGDRAPIHLKQLVKEVEHIIAETFPKSVEFAAQFPAQPWTVKGDATQLHQVLLNLCVNARDAMPNGGKLSITIENAKLDETHARQDLEARPGPYVIIRVSDTGHGIPRQIMDRIFEPFFTTKELNKGTGLGLSTCLGIVRSHGGFINCISEPGKGSTFSVHLPASPVSEPDEHSVAPVASPPCGKNELVLVVDDEAPIRSITQKMLAHFGFRVITAANGAEAVALYHQRQNEIAVVVMDMSMPVMDGHTAIATLKAIHPDVAIIGASGLDTPLGSNGEHHGCRHFITKPYTAEVLLRALNDVLSTPPRTIIGGRHTTGCTTPAH
jgi:CheY-like chemotaxis protein